MATLFKDLFQNANQAGGSGGPASPSKAGEKKKKELFTAETVHDLNFYERLGLDPLGISVGAEQVKKAYHKALLTYHPDKTGRGDEDEVFLAIQEAHNTLCDDTKRKAYDSQNEFDETIPTGNEGKDVDFYALYGPVFHSNGRFAVNLPVPLLGDDGTPIDEVCAFYEYWEKFESWRDFSLSNQEHDPDSADSREEKRWMIKENMKGVKQLKKKDNQRIITLVDRARQRDPRLKRAVEEAKEAKKAAKAAKRAAEEAKVQAAADAKAAEEAAAAAAEAEKKQGAKAIKAEKEKAKKAWRGVRSYLRRLVAQAQEWKEVGLSLPELKEYDVDRLCEEYDGGAPLNLASLQALVDAFGPLQDNEAGPTKAKASDVGRREGLRAVHQALGVKEGQMEEAAAAARAAKAARQAAAESAAEEERARKEAENRWSKEELSWLAKGAKRYPAGAANRWEQVATYINQQMGDKLSGKPKTKEGCLSKFTQIAQANFQASSVMDEKAPASSSPSPSSPSPSSVSMSGAQAAGEGADALWSATQQAALEAALKTFPASMDKVERWAAVAKAVDGKSKKQCVERFKFLRAKIASSKRK